MRDDLQTNETIKLAKTLYKTPAFVRHGVRCGKTSCRCNAGHLHGPYTFLYWRDESGRQRRRYVRNADAEQIERIVQDRQRADREARQAVLAANAELQRLRRWLADVERSYQS